LQMSVLYSKYLKISFKLAAATALVIGVCLSAICYFCIDWLRFDLLKDVPWAVKNLNLVAGNFYVWVVPGIVGLILLLSFIVWFVLRFPAKNILNLAQSELDNMPPKGRGKKDFIDHRIEQERKRRVFLHMLSVLQRDGRLLDFFDEDLELYEDEQIGAAVRSIHDDCRKVIEKYIGLQPVIDTEEGGKIKIDHGFDMDAISLTGNVSGEPPFEGIVIHRGWKAGKKEIPKLADIRDASLITPAQVEIQ